MLCHRPSGIESFNRRTDEFFMNITFEGWFTLDGIKLPAEPTESGVYIHNGKKVVVK